MNAVGVEVDGAVDGVHCLVSSHLVYTHTHTHYLASTDDRPASSRETPTAKSLSALPSSGWADHAQLKAHPLPAMDESHSRGHSRQWMNVSYVHALLCTWQGKA